MIIIWNVNTFAQDKTLSFTLKMLTHILMLPLLRAYIDNSFLLSKVNVFNAWFICNIKFHMCL